MGEPVARSSIVMCDYEYEWFLHSGVYQWHVSPAAPAVVALHKQTHTCLKKTRNESCWELELRSIRVTTYLQTVGGKLPRCDSSTKRHTCTFDSRPASPNCTETSEGEEQRDGRKWQGMDRLKNTHTCKQAGCTWVSTRINKYICVRTNTCTN